VVALADAFASYNPAGNDVDFGFLPPCAGLCRCFRSVASALVTVRMLGGGAGVEEADQRNGRLLRPGRERPSRRRTKNSDELASPQG
jgi:hypothetical protein